MQIIGSCFSSLIVTLFTSLLSFMLLICVTINYYLFSKSYKNKDFDSILFKNKNSITLFLGSNMLLVKFKHSIFVEYYFGKNTKNF